MLGDIYSAGGAGAIRQRTCRVRCAEQEVQVQQSNVHGGEIDRAVKSKSREEIDSAGATR